MSRKDRRTSGCSDVEGGYKDDAATFRADDPEQTLSTDIALAVAEVSGCDPTELRPLNDFIAADALDQLFARRSQGDDSDRVSFSYQGYQVTVYRDREILLRPRDVSDSPAGDHPGDS